MNPKDVISYIEGCYEPAAHGQHRPSWSETAFHHRGCSDRARLTNAEKGKNEQRIIGLNTENAEINEDLIRSDIIFYVRMKDGISQVIINLEA